MTAKVKKPPRPITELADRLDAVREELLTIQRSIEKIEQQETPQPNKPK
jgi:hypothetical protein